MFYLTGSSANTFALIQSLLLMTFFLILRENVDKMKKKKPGLLSCLQNAFYLNFKHLKTNALAFKRQKYKFTL